MQRTPPVQLDTLKLKTVEWNLLVLMAQRRIRTVKDLRDRLRAVGFSMSAQQLGRVVDRMPDRLNTQLLAGLLTVLDCRVDELVKVVPGS